jgi:tetratricopeptide (TPR) repeat protein
MAIPFVGRRRELDTLSQASVEAAAGRRRLLVVRGDPGVGKTFLAERAVEQAEDAGFRAIWGRCWPHGGAPPLWPWQPMLSELLGKRGEHVLADDPGDERVDPERFARFSAVADRLREAAAEQPLMLVIDDVHAADAGTLLLVRFVARTLDRTRLLMLLLRRDAVPDDPAIAEILDSVEREATVLPLVPFDLRETIALLSASTSEVDPSTVITLTRVTGGNPLLLTRAIAAGASGATDAAVTSAISDAVATLSAAERALVGAASVIGDGATIGEVAAVTGAPRSAVVAALHAAGERALLQVERDEVRFEHDLIRDAVLETVGEADRLATHSAMADLLADDARVEQLTRRARHALAAAPLSADRAAIAVEASVAAARAMRRGFAYEQAASLFADAIAMSEHLPRRPAWASLPVEHAEAVLASGRLAEARRLFRHAVDVAEDDRDAVTLGRAAAGLGGVWLNEHRDPIEQQRMLASQRRALAALGDDQLPLRRRLEMRLAAEAVYDGAPVEPVREALARARECGDGAVLAEALSLAHHALMAPGSAAELLPLAEELIAVASAAGEGMLAVMGLMWRTVDLYQLDRPGAERSLGELRQRVEALGCLSIAYVVALIDVMRMTREGRIDEAEEAARAAYELGTAVGDADATGYYAAHVMRIRSLQGREAELLDLVPTVVESPLMMARERALRASIAGVVARAGDAERARSILGGMRPADIMPSSTSLVALASLADVAIALDDADLARDVYAALQPFASLPLVPSLAVTCLGSVERPLALAATAFGDPALALEHLERALVADERIGNRPMAAIAKAELARAVAAAGGGRSRAELLLSVAIEEAESMGMTARRAEWIAWRAALDAATQAGPQCTIARVGNRWVVTAGSARAEVPNLVGMQYVKALVDRPGVDVPAAELAGSSLVDGARHELVDRQTLDQYRQRVRELDAEIAEADDDADLARAEALRLEREDLRDELGRVLGMAGSQRTFTDTSERARTAVAKAVKRAIDAVEEVEPKLAEHLRTSIVTGRVCRYDPR